MVSDQDILIKNQKKEIVDKIKKEKILTQVRENLNTAKNFNSKKDERNELIDKIKHDFDYERNDYKANKLYSQLKHKLSPIKKWENHLNEQHKKTELDRKEQTKEERKNF